MAKFDSITIHPHALHEIMEACEAHQHDGEIKIIATGNTFTVRATDDLFITEVKNPVPNESS